MVFRTVGHRSQRHIDVDIITSGTRKLVFASRHTITGINMLGIAKMEQSPKLCIATQDDIAATSSVTAVGTSFRDILFSTEMQRTCTALA